MELDNLTNLELDRLCAEKMEWKLDGFSLEEDRFGDILMDEYDTPKLYFRPTTNKAQCFDLQASGKIVLDWKGEKCVAYPKKERQDNG